MKTLQNNFTTPEQSKRLLELGVPADSADCYWNSTREHGKVVWFHIGVREIYADFPDWKKYWKYGGVFGEKIPYYLPCWSVGRIMEICKICGSYELAKEIYGRALMYLNTVDGCICEMSYERNKGNLDFSKLEE